MSTSTVRRKHSRVEFVFDERSLVSLDVLERQGHLTPQLKELFIMLTSIKQALDIRLYPILAFKVLDGASVKVTLDLGFWVTVEVEVLIQGVSVPPSLDLAQSATVKAYVEQWLTLHAQEFGPLVFKSSVLDDHRRAHGNILDAYSTDLKNFLLQNELALPYDGLTPTVWTAEHLTTVDRFVFPTSLHRRKEETSVDVDARSSK